MSTIQACGTAGALSEPTKASAAASPKQGFVHAAMNYHRKLYVVNDNRRLCCFKELAEAPMTGGSVSKDRKVLTPRMLFNQSDIVCHIGPQIWANFKDSGKIKPETLSGVLKPAECEPL